LWAGSPLSLVAFRLVPGTLPDNPKIKTQTGPARLHRVLARPQTHGFLRHKQERVGIFPRPFLAYEHLNFVSLPVKY
jgi:hypothetical protein